MDDRDASEPAEVMASGCSGVHGTFDDDADAFSFERDLRSPWPKERGLKGKLDLVDEDGELIFRLSALEKLHFLEGVFTTGAFSPPLKLAVSGWLIFATFGG